jgi:hypothetical protein
MVLQSHFIVIEPVMQHLGDQPSALGGHTFVGTVYCSEFDLPDNTATQEFAIVQCRTKHNQLAGKICAINNERIPNIPEPHPGNKSEWMVDIAIIPKGALRAGNNFICFGARARPDDDYLLDNIIIWYKTL